MATTLEALVKHFRIKRAPYRDGSVTQCVGAASLAKAIEFAATAAHPDYKKHPHQWRLPASVLQATSAKLLARINEISQAATFDALLKIIASCAVPGFGKVAIYDTAYRLGMRLSLHPTVVYLHAGTLEGAQALNQNFARNRLDLSRGVLQMSELPLPLQQLSSAEVEDFLCVYKRYLQDGSAPSDGLEPSGGGCAPPSSGSSRC
jgi:hypothetical protein